MSTLTYNRKFPLETLAFLFSPFYGCFGFLSHFSQGSFWRRRDLIPDFVLFVSLRLFLALLSDTLKPSKSRPKNEEKAQNYSTIVELRWFFAPPLSGLNLDVGWKGGRLLLIIKLIDYLHSRNYLFKTIIVGFLKI